MTSYIKSSAISTSMQTVVNTVIGAISGNSRRGRDRMDYMLEPMQAMTQICSLAFLPIGTKLHIDSNILQTHTPGLGQGLTRYLAGDGKDDLYYLCNVFIQFVNWYGQPRDTEPITISCRESGLFNLMIMLAKNGLDKLIQTYRTSEKPTVLHTLGIYRMILSNPALFMTGIDSRMQSNDDALSTISDDSSIIDEDTRQTYLQMIDTLPSGFNSEAASIDRRPKQAIYSTGDLQVIQGLLQLMTQHSDNQLAVSSYLQSIDYMMRPRHEAIRQWVMSTVGL